MQDPRLLWSRGSVFQKSECQTEKQLCPCQCFFPSVHCILQNFHRLSLLLAKVDIQHRPGRLAQVATLGALFHIDDNGNLGVVRRGIAGKAGVVGALAAVLRRAGLGADRDRIVPQMGRSRTGLGRHAHALFHGQMGLLRVLHLPQNLGGLLLQHLFVVAGNHLG